MYREKFFNLVFYHLCDISNNVARNQKYCAERSATEIIGIFYTGSYFDVINDDEFHMLLDMKNKALSGEYVFYKDEESKSRIMSYLKGGEY